MSIGYLLGTPIFRAEDSNGDPLAGGKLYSYKVGTSTLKDTYQDSTLLVVNSNPVIMNPRGEAIVWLNGPTKLVLKDVDGNTIWTFPSVGAPVASVFTNVKSYGATGDGSTDDTVAINTALTDLASGGSLYFPVGTYKISSGIIVPEGATVEGDGISSVIYEVGTNSEGLILKDNCQVRNLKLLGSNLAYGPNYYHVGIMPYSVRNGSGNDPGTCAVSTYVGKGLVIDNVQFANWDVGIMLLQDSIVTRCTGTAWRECIYSAGSGNIIDNNIVGSCDSWAIDTNGGYCSIVNNTITSCGQTITDGGGIVAAGTTAEKPIEQITITGNRIYDTGVGWGIFILNLDGQIAKRINISDNTLYGGATATTGIRAYPNSPSYTPMQNIIISNNIVDTFINGIDTAFITAGTISGNICKTIAPVSNAAMSLLAMVDCSVMGNVVKTVAGTTGWCYVIDGVCHYVNIADNVASGGTNGFVVGGSIAGSTYIDINHNNFKDNTTPYNDVGSLPATCSVSGNLGVTTRNGGVSAAIASGGTIAHGLIATPAVIQITPADYGPIYYYATANSTNITVTYSGGGTHAFNWFASVE